jgi:predicted AAA+ superfamily ATPase
MITRRVSQQLRDALARQPAVALLGPRQVGKTTLARAVAAERASVYLDLEDPRSRAKLADPHVYFASQEKKLIILDEIHRVPDLFPVLRGIIDEDRRNGKLAGRFLVLGSASLDLLRQAGETLAGRISFIELSPFDVIETAHIPIDQCWSRGGLPGSLLAENEELSMQFRRDFLRTYLERDVAMYVPRVASETLRRLWTMLSHYQGSILNASELSRSLMLSAQSVTRYVDLLCSLMVVRRLPPYFVNVGKRLVRSPKVYIRDSGIVHALLDIETIDNLLGHPMLGRTWEGFVIEQIVSSLPPSVSASFYRTQAGAEADLVLDFAGNERWVIEIKRSSAPRLERGFLQSIQDLQPHRSFVLYNGTDQFAMNSQVTAMGVREFLSELGARK